MLVLSRFKGEQIMIGDSIKITVVEILGDKVRLGVEAPKDVPVDRLEVHLAKQRDRDRTAQYANRVDGVPPRAA